MNEQQALLTPFVLGDLTLKNRIVMAPLTRMRSLPGNVPGPMNAIHYGQRASMGLIITEASQVSPEGIGYPGTPGIHTEDQINGWKSVTQAVHDRGGIIFLQLWHVGRVSHPTLQPGRTMPVAPSAIAMKSKVFTATGELDNPVIPRALQVDEIHRIAEQFKKGAENAKRAGFDGVELHSANGYLLDQFLRDGTNKRNDMYGGSFENRVRFLHEIIQGIARVYQSNRIGVRLSPHGTFNDIHDSNSEQLFRHVIESLNQYNLGYIHLVEPRVTGGGDKSDYTGGLFTQDARKIFKNAIITAGGYDRETGNQVIEEGTADLVAYGRFAIANPDLAERFSQKAELNPYDRATFYGGTEKGYNDYPCLNQFELASNPKR